MRIIPLLVLGFLLCMTFADENHLNYIDYTEKANFSFCKFLDMHYNFSSYGKENITAIKSPFNFTKDTNGEIYYNSGYVGIGNYSYQLIIGINTSVNFYIKVRLYVRVFGNQDSAVTKLKLEGKELAFASIFYDPAYMDVLLNITNTTPSNLQINVSCLGSTGGSCSNTIYTIDRKSFLNLTFEVLNINGGGGYNIRINQSKNDTPFLIENKDIIDKYFVTDELIYYSDYTSATKDTQPICNTQLLFSNRILKPLITYFPSIKYQYAVYPYYFDKNTLISYIMNTTPAFVKDEYFGNWYYVPSISCYNNDTIPVSAYLLSEQEVCDSKLASNNTIGEIDTYNIFLKNVQASCSVQNTTEPYYFNCSFTDPVGLATEWIMSVYKVNYTQQTLYCQNTTKNETELLCNFDDTSQKYVIRLQAKVNDNNILVKSFWYVGNSLSSPYVSKELTAIFIIMGIVLVGLTMIGYVGLTPIVITAFLIIVYYIGFIAYGYSLLVLLIIVSVVIAYILLHR